MRMVKETSMKTMLKSIIRVLTAILTIISIPIAQAGFGALPLEAELDIAQKIVVGKITKIEVTKIEYDGKMQSGTATISVEETLKGGDEKTVTTSVVMRLDREIDEKMQSPPRVFKVGDEGIWLIMEDNKPSHGYGLLERSKLEEIKKNLKMLNERKWSDAARGIKVWTGIVKFLSGNRSSYGVIFAVKNVSDSTIYLPRSLYSGIVSVIAENKDGKQIALHGLGDQVESKDNLMCMPLLPNQIRYMHWDGENYGCYLIPKGFAPGKYKVRGTLSNDKAVGSLNGPKEERKSLWTGKITSPDAVLTVEEKKEEGK
jgi:hypothetical protein